MAIKDEIQLLNINAVALRKATDEHQRKVEQISQKLSRPSSAVRQNRKMNRVEGIALFYTKRKIS